MLTNVDYTFPTVGPDYRKNDNLPTISHSAWNRRQRQNRPSALMDVCRFVLGFVLGLYIGLPRLIRNQVRLKARQYCKGFRATRLRNIGNFSARRAQIVRNPACHRSLNSHRRISAARRHSPPSPVLVPSNQSRRQCATFRIQELNADNAEEEGVEIHPGEDSASSSVCPARSHSELSNGWRIRDGGRTPHRPKAPQRRGI